MSGCIVQQNSGNHQVVRDRINGRHGKGDPPELPADPWFEFGFWNNTGSHTGYIQLASRDPVLHLYSITLDIDYRRFDIIECQTINADGALENTAIEMKQVGVYREVRAGSPIGL